MLSLGAALQPIGHGGEPCGAGENWLDLSTGINPVPYPFSPPDPASWIRLPRKAELAALLDAAAAYYQAPDADHLAAAPGSQALIQLLPRLFAPGRVQIVSPTYGEHAVCWTRGAHKVEQISHLDEADPAHNLVVVNPNNPDGRCWDTETMARVAEQHTAAGSWLVVDEAFADVMPGNSAAALVCENNVIVLKSFGKFFGLAGLRLGFALAPRELAQTVAAEFGPWAVSGPALNIATRALADEAWCKAARIRLAHDALRLDESLTRAGLEVVGGTDLFRLTRAQETEAYCAQLRRAEIHVRRFADHPHWLRFGLPAPHQADRLSAALAGVPVS